MYFEEDVLKISINDVEQAARAIELEITEQEKEQFTAELNNLLVYVSSISEPDTRGVPPTTHPGGLVNAFREDEVRPSLGTQGALANAPDKRGDFFRVPKIID
jgi:aspartyl-tRNA(Asn)/glutamyl-tRNA(Gln) amidotransferase subunit C